MEVLGENPIKGFSGENSWLSNLFPREIEFNGETFSSRENCFQAQKTLKISERRPFYTLEPGKAKRLGRTLKLREDWEEVKEILMYDIVKTFFKQHSDLAARLLLTNSRQIINENYWGDTFWGVTFWGVWGEVGENKLGKILMRVRAELRLEAAESLSFWGM